MRCCSGCSIFRCTAPNRPVHHRLRRQSHSGKSQRIDCSPDGLDMDAGVNDAATVMSPLMPVEQSRYASALGNSRGDLLLRIDPDSGAILIRPAKSTKGSSFE